MELTEALARLVTDRGARDRFTADARTWIRDAELAASDAASLGAIPEQALVRYAESLLDKRTEELVHALPIATTLFPPLLDVYRSWLARNPAPSVDDVLQPGLREALRAVQVLAAEAEPAWVAELVVYEILWRCSRRDGRVRRLSTRWPQHRLMEQVLRGEVPLDPDEEPQEYAFP